MATAKYRRVPTIATIISIALLRSAFLAPAPALAHDAFLREWYGKLEAVDLEGLEKLIAPGAVFTLEEFGSTQTKDEFMDYMRQHGDALGSVDIRYKVESQSSNRTTVRVCYDFVESDPVFNRETYAIEGGIIISATQARIGDRCDGI